MNTDRRLARSSTDRVLAGVCGGVANYLNVDPTFVRLAFVLMVLFAGFSPLLYLLLWVVMPSDDAAGQPYADQVRDNASDMGHRFGELAGQVSAKVGKLLDGSTSGASQAQPPAQTSTPELPQSTSAQQYTMPSSSDDTAATGPTRRL